MRKINNRNEAYNSMMKVAKRVVLTILCSLPVVILFAYFTRNVITSNALQIICFMAIMGAAVAVVEVIARNKEKRQKEEIETKKDVFR